MLKRFAQDVIKLYLLRGVISLSIVPFLSEYDVKDGVRAAACLVHVGGSHSPAHTVKTFLLVCLDESLTVTSPAVSTAGQTNTGRKQKVQTE